MPHSGIIYYYKRGDDKMNLAKRKDYTFENRLGIERRKFSYSIHIPERRSTMDRRGGDKHHSKDSSYSREGDIFSLYVCD
jgi:hypothetical protein